VSPLVWREYTAAPLAELTNEFAELTTRLGAASGDDAAAVAAELGALRLVGAEAMVQSFMPAVDVLRLTLDGPDGTRHGIFLRQLIAAGLPRLWPLLDTSGNLYVFLEGLPGVLDLTRETALDYGIFFASEAIVADDGEFVVFPDFAALPPEYQDRARDGLPDLKRRLANPETIPGDDQGPAGLELLARTIGHLEAAVAGREPTGFSLLEYDRDDDEYFFVVFVAYGDALYAATIAISRATGIPYMASDAPIAAIGPVPRRSRLRPGKIHHAFHWVDFRFPDGTELEAPALSGDEAAAIIAGGGTIENRAITGDITFSRSVSIPRVRLGNCHLAGSLLLSGSKIGGEVHLEDVHVAGSIDLRGAEIGGALEFARCEVMLGVTLADARVTTAVRLSGFRAIELHARRLVVVRGPIAIGSEPAEGGKGPFGAIVSGSLDLSGCSTPSWITLAGTSVAADVNLANARAGGGIELGADPTQPVFVQGGLELGGCQVNADVAIRSAHVGGSVTMAGTTIGGRLRLGPAHGATSYQQIGCSIGRDLAIGYARIAGAVTLSGVQVQGTLRFELSELGSLVIEPRLVWDQGADRVTTLLPSRIRNRVEIQACEIRGELAFTGALIDERYAGRYAVELTSSRVGQGVTFWEEGLAEGRSGSDLTEYLDAVAEQVGSRKGRWVVRGYESRAPRGGWPIGFEDLPVDRPLPGKIEGADEISIRELRASLSARHVFTEVRGDVRMALCRIGGDLSLTNLRAPGRALVLEGLEIVGDLAAEWTGRRYVAPAADWAARFTGLLETAVRTMEVSGSTVKGEARLTGLRIPGGGAVDQRPIALAVRYSTIDGVLALCDVHDPPGPVDPRSRAALGGDLDVSWSTVDHLVLDGRSLGAGEAVPDRPNRLVAASATIRKLELRDPLPGEVDLADAKVSVWDFGPVDGTELLGRFRNVLGNQHPFTRNVYQEVEAYLHNAGFEDLAKAVHVDLVTRNHRNTIARLRRAPGGLRARSALVWAGFQAGLSRINRFATGNFTSELRPILCCWLPVWLMSSCYFADPARVDVASQYRRAFLDHPEPVCALLDHWTFFDSMKLTTRYVLPVVPSVGLDEVDASDELETHPLCIGAAERIRSAPRDPVARIRASFDWFRPSTVAAWARLLSWIFLSLATGTIFAKMSRTPRARG
jgi:hypothetical protein